LIVDAYNDWKSVDLMRDLANGVIAYQSRIDELAKIEAIPSWVRGFISVRAD